VASRLVSMIARRLPPRATAPRGRRNGSLSRVTQCTRRSAPPLNHRTSLVPRRRPSPCLFAAPLPFGSLAFFAAGWTAGPGAAKARVVCRRACRSIRNAIEGSGNLRAQAQTAAGLQLASLHAGLPRRSRLKRQSTCPVGQTRHPAATGHSSWRHGSCASLPAVEPRSRRPCC
jgi:hypothetical protein